VVIVALSNKFFLKKTFRRVSLSVQARESERFIASLHFIIHFERHFQVKIGRRRLDNNLRMSRQLLHQNQTRQTQNSLKVLISTAK